MKYLFFIFLLIILRFEGSNTRDFEDIFFHVYRNDSKIGHHKLKFSNNGEETSVDIEIDFKVSFLGFVLYDYYHSNVEKWSGNKLLSLTTQTNKNGEKLYCNLINKNSSKKITGTFNPIEFPDNLISTSYWNKQLVNSDNKIVLNTQDCSLINFKIKDLGTKNIYNEKLLASHYKLIGKESSGEDLDIDIWYDGKGNWVKMIFLKDGSIIEYFLDGFHE